MLLCFKTKPLKGQFLHFLSSPIKIRELIGEISESLFKRIIPMCVLHFCYVALCWNQGASKATAAENRGHILYFLTHVQLGDEVGEMSVNLTSSA